MTSGSGVSSQLAVRDVSVEAGAATLDGTLTLPRTTEGIVLFAHGSGSGRHSPRNRFVARRLAEAGLATLLMDLLTADEEAEDIRGGRLRFDIDLLTERLVAAVDWTVQERDAAGLPIGCFGASTGAAAALRAAASRPAVVRAVVSRGGRPDLAAGALPNVTAPTLLIVGGEDHQVIRLNEQALDALECEAELEIVPGATHLFEEPGALDAVAELAREWFLRHLAAAEAQGPPREGNPGPAAARGTKPFRDRQDAGRALGERLHRYAGAPDVVVLGLARGGVPVAAEVARTLDAPLDVFLVRKLGVPGREELAMGAIASGGVQVLNREIVEALGLSEEEISDATREQRSELARREQTYREGRPAVAVEGRTVIVVDDGLATGASMRAAVEALRRQGAGHIVVGVPVASPSTCAEFEEEVDEVVCVRTPERFYAVGIWYDAFPQVDDDEVRALLAG
jgi:predicted phosphoribosyltransferase/dienelactone hydrolase